MSNTPVLGLPEIAEGVASQTVLHNQALRLIEARIVRVLSRTTAAPPGAPAEGDSYVVPAGATGDWSGLTDQVASYVGGGWVYLTPGEGVRLWVNDADETVVFDGAAWVLSEGSAGGSGDVVGPASSTDGHFATYDGATGKLLKDTIALDIDTALAADSDTRVASQKAVKAYVTASGGGSGDSITGTTGATGGNAVSTGGTSTTSANAGGESRMVGGTPGATGVGGISRITGGAGGSTSGAGGAVILAGGVPTDGIGGAISLNGGAGVSASTTRVGGAVDITAGMGSSATNGGTGGAVSITAGTGGTGSTARGAGGAITILAGAAGASGNSNAGGSVSITGGTSGSSTQGGAVNITGGVGGTTGVSGGPVTIQSGTGASGGTISLLGATGSSAAGGPIVITAGAGPTSVSGANANVTITGGTGQSGGPVTLKGGAATGISAGGAANLTGGVGGSGGAGHGGAVNITAGAPGSTGNAGAVNITAGTPVAGDGGAINITATSGVGTNKPGGNVTITAGAATGSGARGAVNFVGALALNAQNAIINGDFLIWQRGTSFVALASGTYTADRFRYVQAGTMVHTVSQSTDVPTVAQAGRLFTSSLLVDCTTADASMAASDLCCIQQMIEGYNFAALAQRACILSFWVKATKTGIYSVGFANTAGDRGVALEYTINTTATWEYKAIVVPASPSAGTWDYISGTGVSLTFALAAGTDFQSTPGSWLTTTSAPRVSSSQVNACDSTANDFRITGVDLRPGAAAPAPFQSRSFGEELALCQRYYCKSYPQGTVPGTTGLPGLRMASGVTAAAIGTNNLVLQFPVPMRAAPTVTLFNAETGASGTWSPSSVAMTALHISDQSALANNSGTATAGVLFFGHFTASAEL